MNGTVYPLFAARIWRMGQSVVFPLAKLLMQALEAQPGDLVLVRVHLPYVTFRIANPDLSLPVPRFRPEELPPSYEELLKELGANIKRQTRSR
jgi:antitoxin component of MazEF toxin-antitoxin module